MTECSNCTYGHPKKVLGRAFCTKRKKIINKNYVDLTESVFAAQCVKCENINKWNKLDLKEQNLIMLYDLALKNKNPELAVDTFLELSELDIQDITVPNNI